MIRSPYTTLSSVVKQPRSFDLGVLLIVVATACSVGFLLTNVGRLAALDQEVRQLESIGTVVTDARYAELRRLLPYRPAISAAVIIVGWPIARALGRRFERRGAPPAMEAGMTDQLQRIEQAVEAIAIEVERISESQRFLAKLQEKSPAALE